ncbi:unnamed protein product [Anisakis simplex]|uniref:Transmembrane protein n=1 Tax=Anisakis simplex TaxID=6269 RepID=A0A0M3JMN9_ANISI|nr:unnamed protein product [Anisakis simplex]
MILIGIWRGYFINSVMLIDALATEKRRAEVETLKIEEERNRLKLQLCERTRRGSSAESEDEDLKKKVEFLFSSHSFCSGIHDDDTECCEFHK